MLLQWNTLKKWLNMNKSLKNHYYFLSCDFKILQNESLQKKQNILKTKQITLIITKFIK